jgi:hypothetical protein
MTLAADNEKAAAQIVTMYQERRMQRGGTIKRMMEIRDHYNGDIIVPLPELDDVEKPAIPNLIAQGIDQFSMRVASVMPDVQFRSLRPGIGVADNRATDRRSAVLGWWEMNQMTTKIRRRSRHLTAYGQSIVSLSPVSLTEIDQREIPFWRVRNPLSSFPSPMIDPDNMEPEDCIFVDRRTLGWLRSHYPSQTGILYRGNKSDTDLFEILEYLDANETVLIAIGAERPKSDGWSVETGKGAASHIILERIPNRSEICPVVVAGRITLDRLHGQFDQMLGMYQRQAKLDALNTIAIFRNVFPDEWVVSPANSPTSPRIVQEADGKMGIRGVIDKGQVQIIHPQQGPDVSMAMDRLERSSRMNGLLPAEFGGESPSNVRTARRGSAVLGETVDMPLQEYQEIFAASLEYENERAIKIMKSYYGKKGSMFYMGTDGKVTKPDYTPNETFDATAHHVIYPVPGSDINDMIVALGQRIATGMVSTQTARELDPLIKDPSMESLRVEVEGMRKAILTGIEQQASSGSMGPDIIARIIKMKMENHVALEEAVMKVHEEMQQEQQDQQQQMAQNQQPSPEMQPGVNAMPNQAPVGQAAKPSLQDLLGSLGSQGLVQGV